MPANHANLCHLEGIVRPDAGGVHDSWTRYSSCNQGQIRFWLEVPRLMSGVDLLLCAIEIHSADDLHQYEEQLVRGRQVQLQARAYSLVDATHPNEARASVVFVAGSCGFDGAAQAAIQRRPRLTGKMAAAGDDSLATIDPTVLDRTRQFFR